MTRTRLRRTLGAALVLPLVLAAPASAATTVVRPGSLARGPVTGLLHTEGGTIVDGATRVAVDAPGVSVLGRAGHDYVVATRDANGASTAVVRVTPDGSTTTLARRFDDAMLSEDGTRLVVAATGTTAGSEVLRVLSTEDGTVLGRRTSTRWQQVVEHGNRRVLLSQSDRSGNRTYWWNPVTGRTTLVARQAAGPADIGADRLELYTKDPYDGGCARVVRLSKPSEELWRSCREGVVTFSPDGQRMFTTFILSDGPGPGEWWLRGAHGGEVAHYSARRVGHLVFEGGHRPLMQVAGAEVAAMVRRTADGLELGSARYDAGPRYSELTRMDWSFPTQ